MIQPVKHNYTNASPKHAKKIKTSTTDVDMAKHDAEWGYSKSALGRALLKRATTRTYDSWLEAWCDKSLEHYDRIVNFVNVLLTQLHCTESVEGSTYRYMYKDSVLFESNLDVVTFPALNAILHEFAEPKPEILDNPLLGFLMGFLSVDSHIYGPAQGLYNMYIEFYTGYLVSHYPETREWLIPPKPKA